MAVNTITIPEKEYQDLVEKKLRYEHLRSVLEEDIFSPPPTRNVRETLQAFKETGKYNQRFLKSLEKGLKRSSYFRA